MRTTRCFARSSRARCAARRLSCSLRVRTTDAIAARFGRLSPRQRRARVCEGVKKDKNLLSVEVRPRLNLDPKAHSQTLTLTLVLSTQRALWPPYLRAARAWRCGRVLPSRRSGGAAHQCSTSAMASLKSSERLLAAMIHAPAQGVGGTCLGARAFGSGLRGAGSGQRQR